MERCPPLFLSGGEITWNAYKPLNFPFHPSLDMNTFLPFVKVIQQVYEVVSGPTLHIKNANLYALTPICRTGNGQISIQIQWCQTQVLPYKSDLTDKVNYVRQGFLQ
jgi:hypothetical protein